MTEDNTLSPSLEDYLEAILSLEEKNRVARVKDIADLLNVQMPSVTGALKNLKKKQLVNYQKNSYISLTEEGLEIAHSIQDKHSILTNFLETVLFVNHDKAEDIACKMEHALDPDTMQRLHNCTEYMKSQFSNKAISRESWNSILSKRG